MGIFVNTPERKKSPEPGKIYAGLIRSGKRIELNDCLIAATALSLGINKIVTRNKKRKK